MNNKIICKIFYEAQVIKRKESFIKKVVGLNAPTQSFHLKNRWSFQIPTDYTQTYVSGSYR